MYWKTRYDLIIEESDFMSFTENVYRDLFLGQTQPAVVKQIIKHGEFFRCDFHSVNHLCVVNVNKSTTKHRCLSSVC